jgi:hypothetical protein
VEHRLLVGFNNSFIHIILNEEEDNTQSAHVHNAGDLETILSTNEFYKQKGKGPTERNTQSPVVTPKNIISWSNASTNYLVRKIANNSSSGGEKNAPSGKIENSHKFPIRKKRKI